MNYLIVLFKNKERKKIIKSFKTYENAKKFYEASLNWQESDNASNELEIIAKALNDTENKVIRTGSNFNDAMERK